MKKLRILGFLSIAGFNCIAQGLFLNDYRASGKPFIVDKNESVSGTPFLFDSWQQGYVYISDKIKSDIILIRYDVYSDVVEMQEGQNVYALDPARIKGFKFTISDSEGKSTYHFRNGFTQIKSFSVSAYFEILHEDKNIFLKRYTKKLTFDPGSYGSAKSKSLVNDMKFFVIKSSGEVLEFQPTKKSILKIFGEHNEQIDSFIESNAIKFNNREDLQELLKFLDGLM